MNGNPPGRLHTAASVALLCILALVAFYMAFCSTHARCAEKDPPDWARVVRVGCRIDQISPPPNYPGVVRFRVIVWARYQNNPQKAPEWQDTLSMYERGKKNKGRRQAYNDCHEWLNAADAAMRKAQEAKGAGR